MGNENTEKKENTVAQEIIDSRKPETIDVDLFVQEYRKRKSESAKAAYIKSVVKVKNYIPYSTKVFLSETIINNSTVRNDGSIYFDSPKRMCLFFITTIESYTNIKFGTDHPMSQYEALDSEGLIDVLVELLPENEYRNFKTILDMKLEDFTLNRLDSRVKSANILKVLEPIGSELVNKLTSLTSEIDKDKLLELLEELQK